MQDGSSLTAPNGIDQAQFEADKRAVYKHPLFSLLALMLEKCEQATQGYVSTSSSSSSSHNNQSSSSSPNGSSANGDQTDSFSRDVHAFVQLLEKEKRPLLTNNAELDGLMIKALQVLRIHLLELEKVQELCRDFCTRYIACLRGKMQSENLLRSDYPLEHNNNNSMSNSNSPVNNNNSPEQEPITLSQPPVYFGGAEYLSGVGTGSGAAADASDFSSIQGAYNIQNSASASESSFSSLNGGAVNHPSVVGDGNAAPSASAINSASTPSSSSTSSDIVAQIGHAHNSNAVAGADLPALLEPNNSQQHSTGSQQQQLHLQATQLHQQHEQHLQQQQQQLLAHAAAASSSANAAAAAAAAAALLTPHMLGQTGLGQMGCTGGGLGLGDPYANQLSPCGSSDEGGDSELDSNADELSSNFSSTSGSKRHKRGILPKQATSVMRAWLFQHLVHPYPTEDEKRTIAAQTNLTLLQVNNWFINARRRILQPMLEHASDSSSNNGRKKSSPPATSPSKHQSNPQQLSQQQHQQQQQHQSTQQQQHRFWTETSCSGSSPLQQLLNPSMIDPNIENISANVNRASDTERLAIAQKLAAAHAAAADGANSYYSSDDSNDSLVIDHDS